MAAWSSRKRATTRKSRAWSTSPRSHRTRASPFRSSSPTRCPARRAAHPGAGQRLSDAGQDQVRRVVRWGRRPERAAFLANAQVPWGVEALTGEVTAAAWRTKPSWYLVAKDDKMIPPVAQRAMSQRAGATVVESAGATPCTSRGRLLSQHSSKRRRLRRTERPAERAQRLSRPASEGFGSFMREPKES